MEMNDRIYLLFIIVILYIVNSSYKYIFLQFSGDKIIIQGFTADVQKPKSLWTFEFLNNAE